MKIWVAYRDFGAYDGKSEPLAAFAIEREKDAYLAGAAASDIGSMLVREFDVPLPEIFPNASPLTSTQAEEEWAQKMCEGLTFLPFRRSTREDFERFRVEDGLRRAEERLALQKAAIDLSVNIPDDFGR